MLTAAITELLHAGREAGLVRADIEPDDVLFSLGGLSLAATTPRPTRGWHVWVRGNPPAPALGGGAGGRRACSLRSPVPQPVVRGRRRRPG